MAKRPSWKEWLFNWMGLRAPLMWLAQRFLMLWVKATVLPTAFEEAQIDLEKPICYVLDIDGVSNTLVLRDVAHELGLPDSGGTIRGGVDQLPALVFMRSLKGMLVRRADPRISDDFRAVVKAYGDGHLSDVQFVPVSMFWGRAASKEDSTVKLMFSDSWSIAGRLRKLMIILVHGRHMFVQFGRPLTLAEQFPERPLDRLAVRKISRTLRVHFRRVREAAMGPDLSHRRLLVSEIVDSDSVRRAIDLEASREGISDEKARQKALFYAREIAANYSHSFIRLMEGILSWLWNSLYDGIEQNNFSRVRDVAQDCEVIYVPCHRSHIDYLLLSYCLYVQGLVPPHIAAGINLNMPVIGGFLRKGGAFFLRRTFRGQRLYAAVFDAYLRRNLSKGVSIEYFIEGTRSRIGKLLDPKSGMLSMTVKSYLRDQARPVVFVPVYIGYERLLEGRSYERELGGAAKQKETVWGLIKSLRLIRKNFGHVFVNYGEPIHLNRMLDEVSDDWREWPRESIGGDERAARDSHIEQLSREVVPGLGKDILKTINNNVAVGPVNLLGMVLQATEKNALPESDLVTQINFYVDLIRRVPYSPDVTLANQIDNDHPGKSTIDYGVEFELLIRHQHSLGDVIGLHPQNGRLLNYYRNNVKHILLIPSLVACAFMSRSSVTRKTLMDLVGGMYALARGEYFLRWKTDEIEASIDAVIDQLSSRKLLRFQASKQRYYRPKPDTSEIRQLDILAHLFFGTLERYSVILNLLLAAPSGSQRQGELLEKNRISAERMAMLNEDADQERFDARALKRVVVSLLASDMLWRDDDRNLCYGADLERIGSLVVSALDVPTRRIALQR